MYIRRFLILAAGTALIFIGTKAHAFSDVPENSRYSEAFAYLQKNQIVRGYSDGTVRPFDLISRVEGLTAILRSNEKYAPQVVWFRENLPDISLFTDINQNEWYTPFIEVGFLEGIITGNGNGTIDPAGTLTVAQALVMLDRAYGDAEKNMTYRTDQHLRNWPDQWFTKAVSTAHARNLIPPFEYLELSSPITRGQFFAILQRLHSIEHKKQFVFINEPQTIAQTLQPSQPSKLAIPFTIKPLPFDSSDPFVLWLPQTTRYGPEPLESTQRAFASDQEFAITIPALEINDIFVKHPDDPFSSNGILEPLKVGLGHLFAYPGDTGKIMIYGHSSGFPWDVSQYTRVFRQINKLVTGQRVYITYKGTLYVYEVYRKQVIDADDVSAFDDNGTSELILYTCWPPDSIKQRYLVHAIPVEKVALR